MRVLTVHKKIVLARCPDEGWSSPRDMIKKNQKIVLALCPDEGWSPPREKNKKNITESMFRREADSFLVSVFYPRIIFIPRLVQELMESFCE